jgi:hypothetical protein
MAHRAHAYQFIIKDMTKDADEQLDERDAEAKSVEFHVFSHNPPESPCVHSLEALQTLSLGFLWGLVTSLATGQPSAPLPSLQVEG